MLLSLPSPQARRRSVAGRAALSAASNKGRKTSRSFRGRMSTGSGKERSGEQSRLILSPFPVRRGNVPRAPRRARRRRQTSATRDAKKTTGLQAATPGRGQTGNALQRKTFPQARSEGGKNNEARRHSGRKARGQDFRTAPQRGSTPPHGIFRVAKQAARALTRLSGRRAAPRVSIRSSGQRQTRATWWNPRPVPSSRRCRLHAAPQCAGKCTARGRSPCCPWWRKTDRKSSSGSLR